MTLPSITANLSRGLARLGCPAPATHVYNPLEYALRPYLDYLERYGGSPEAVLVGMNPGPWGMAQTGVPFGDVEFVRDWLGIEGEVVHPAHKSVVPVQIDIRQVFCRPQMRVKFFPVGIRCDFVVGQDRTR